MLAMTTSTIPERVSRLAGLLAREREALAQFISELADFDAQRCWESLGYPSLFEFLTRELKLSRGNAFYRTKAVGLVRRFPEALEALHEGKLCLSCVPEVARVLTEANRTEVLPRFFHLSREDAKLLSVELVPREVVPVREVVSAVRPVAPAAPVGLEPTLALVPQTERVQLLNCTAPNALDRTSHPPPAPSAPPLPESSELLTGQLSRLHLNVSRELQAKIKAALLALSHARPGATIAGLLELGAETALAAGAASGSWPAASAVDPGTGSSTTTSNPGPRAARRRWPTSGSSASSTPAGGRGARTSRVVRLEPSRRTSRRARGGGQGQRGRLVPVSPRGRLRRAARAADEPADGVAQRWDLHRREHQHHHQQRHSELGHGSIRSTR
jgi:hypothetical protein